MHEAAFAIIPQAAMLYLAAIHQRLYCIVQLSCAYSFHANVSRHTFHVVAVRFAAFLFIP